MGYNLCGEKYKREKNRQFLKSIKTIYKQGYKFRVLLIIASDISENDKVFDNGLLEYFNATFSIEEKTFVTVLKTDPKIGSKGLPLETIAHFYNQSKIFTIFSQEEGESRVIKEAQLCGLPVVVKSDIRGGGADYLNHKNSLTFNDYDCAADVLIQAVKEFDKFELDLKELREEIGEVNNIEKLKDYFSNIFARNDLQFDGDLINTDNLNWRLPAQFSDDTTPWARGEKYRFKTSDVLTIGQFRTLFIYCNSIKKN